MSRTRTPMRSQSPIVAGTCRRRRSHFPLLGAAVSLAFLLPGCGGGDDPEDTADATTIDTGTADTETQTSEASESTSAATSALPTTSTSSTTSTTIPPVGASPDDPAPVGDPQFDLVGYESDGSSSDTSITGLVALPLKPDAVGGVECYAILGVFTGVESTGLALPDAALPRVSLVLDDEEDYGDSIGCDSSGVSAAGWSDDQLLKIVAGTGFPFARVVTVPAGSTLAEWRIRAGSGGGSPDTRYYTPTLLAAVPPAPAIAAGAITEPLRSVTDPAANTVTATGARLDPSSVWQMTVLGVRGIERDPASDVPGSCVAVFGHLTGVKSPGAIVNFLSIPRVALVVDGVVRPEAVGECDVSPLVAAGYDNRFEAGVAPGNTFPFTYQFVVPEGGTVNAVVAGTPDLPGAYWLFDATPTADILSPPPFQGVNPSITPTPAGDASSFTIEGFEVVWSGSVFGLVELPAPSAELRCLAVVGTIGLDGADAFPPQVGVIADGVIYGGGSSFSCGDPVLAGYTPLRDLSAGTVAAGTRFVDVVAVPSTVTPFAISIGNAADPEESAFFEPLVLAAAP